MKKWMGILLLLLPLAVLADTIEGSYVAPTEREDFTALPIEEIATYKVYQDGTEITDYMPYPLTNLDTEFLLDRGPGKYKLNLTTVDTEGRESVFSTTVDIHIKTNPKAPTIIKFSVSK